MTEEFIYGFNKKIIGILQHLDNGDILALSFPGRQILGQFVQRDNHTIEFPSRKILNKGNTVVQFFYKK